MSNKMEGPDFVLPAENYTTSEITKPVKLRLTEANAKMVKPVSIYTIFKNTVNKNPDFEMLAFKPDPQGPWCKMTTLEYWRVCHKSAKSFIKLGLGISEVVGISGFNAPQWFISMLGAIFAGGVGCGIYTTNSAEQCEYVLNDSKIKILVVENDKQLEKIMKIKNNTLLTKIIQYTGKVNNSYNGLVISWDEFIELGNDINDALLQERIKSIAPNKCASLIYTSGTTGQSKAAMISHDNICTALSYLPENLVQLDKFKERLVSYLPLSHIAAQIVDLFATLYHGITVYFAQPDALKGSLNTTIKEVRPTFFFGVPRVWEKIQERIEKIIKDLKGIKLKLFNWARRVASAQIKSNFDGKSKTTLSFKIAKALVLNKIHKQLGFEQCRHFYSGAAPITKETLEFFISLGIPLCEVFGMSETTGPHILGLRNRNRVTSIGCVNPIMRSRLANVDKDGCGELQINGRHVFMGYLNDQKKTDETFDREFWINTGDQAKIEDEFIYITGRLKELIITAGGENVAPVPIENNVKAELPDVISNSIVIGDKLKFLSILVALKTDINLDTMEPLDKLTPECVEYLKSQGSNSTTVTQVLSSKDPVVFKLIEAAIRRANEKAVSNASKIQKFRILPRDFSLAHGELGPTLKLRRPIVNKMYANLIKDIYEEASAE